MPRIAPDLAHALAAEYVLGTLRGRARRRLEAIAREDREVARIVGAWEDAMTPLAEGVAPVEPPARVWRAIESRIATAPREKAPGWGVAFWRNLALGTGALAVALVAAFLTFSRPSPREPMMVAVLTASDAAPRAVASLYAPDTLRVRIVKPWGSMEGLSLELWAMPRDGGPPRSLGLVANAIDRETLIRLPPHEARLRDVGMLAVTMEPAGGSPTRRPTGSMVCSGAVALMRRT